MDENSERPDVARGRRIAVASLSIIGLTAAIVTALQLSRASAPTHVALGNLMVMLLVIYLTWRGLAWARWLIGTVIAVGSVGTLMMAFAGGSPTATDASYLLPALVYVVSFLYMVRSRDAQAFFLAQRDHPIPVPSNR